MDRLQPSSSAAASSDIFHVKDPFHGVGGQSASAGSSSLATVNEKTVVAYDSISRHVLICKEGGMGNTQYEWQPLITLKYEYLHDIRNVADYRIIIDRLKNTVKQLKQEPYFHFKSSKKQKELQDLWNLNRDLPVQYGFKYDAQHPFIGYIPAEINRLEGHECDMIIYKINYHGRTLVGITDYNSLNITLIKLMEINEDYNSIYDQLQKFVAEAQSKLEFLKYHLLQTNYIGRWHYEWGYNKIVNGHFYEPSPAMGKEFNQIYIDDLCEAITAVDEKSFRTFMDDLYRTFYNLYPMDQYEKPNVMQLIEQSDKELYERIKYVRNQAYSGNIPI